MPCTIVIGAQWGDEGKGKIVDLLAADHDLIVRFQGGPNAGHSVIHEDRVLVLHLIPSAILHPQKRCLIGNGVVVDPKTLLDELSALSDIGVQAEQRLRVSRDAHVILPYHRLAEREREEGPSAVGTTRRGIGPAYEDKVARVGLRVGDLLDERALRQAVTAVKARAQARLRQSDDFPSVDEVVSEYQRYGLALQPLVGDTRIELWEALDAGKRVLLEGAQGTLLDIDHGTYPFVTSSNAVAGGALTGAGIGPREIDKVLGVAKAYTTRVGNGPFVTEFDETMGDRIREVGDEFGATTGRPRRCGWPDAVALRFAARVNGIDELVITKLDILDDLEEIAIARAYRGADGETQNFVPDGRRLAGYEPVYEWIPGWKSTTRGTSRFEDLPRQAQVYLRRIAEIAGLPVTRVSLGPEREATLTVPPA